MSSLTINDLSVEQTLTEIEANQILGGASYVHYGPRGRRIYWGRRYPRPRYPRWRDTSHWDYYPGGVYPHGDHYHYVPGHYRLHRSGYWQF